MVSGAGKPQIHAFTQDVTERGVDAEFGVDSICPDPGAVDDHCRPDFMRAARQSIGQFQVPPFFFGRVASLSIAVIEGNLAGGTLRSNPAKNEACIRFIEESLLITQRFLRHTGMKHRHFGKSRLNVRSVPTAQTHQPVKP